MTKRNRKTSARANGKRLAAPKPAETAPQTNPIADRLRALADEIDKGGVDSWVVCAVRPDGRFSAESNFGTHHLTALGFMQALCSKMAVWSAAALFGVSSLTPAAQGQIQR
jgi:hypothetical protein